MVPSHNSLAQTEKRAGLRRRRSGVSTAMGHCVRRRRSGVVSTAMGHCVRRRRSGVVSTAMGHCVRFNSHGEHLSRYVTSHPSQPIPS